jgi:hypothetical protein
MFQWQYHVIFLVIGIRIFFPDHHQVLLNEQNKLNGNITPSQVLTSKIEFYRSPMNCNNL